MSSTDSEKNWIPCEKELPLIGLVVNTKIDDAYGIRNEQALKLINNKLWFLPDDSMYVYYSPTHWSIRIE